MWLNPLVDNYVSRAISTSSNFEVAAAHVRVSVAEPARVMIYL